MELTFKAFSNLVKEAIAANTKNEVKKNLFEFLDTAANIADMRMELQSMENDLRSTKDRVFSASSKMQDACNHLVTSTFTYKEDETTICTGCSKSWRTKDGKPE